MTPREITTHVVAMLAAGAAAGGLILAASLLSPAAEPPSRAEGPSTVKPGAVTAEAIVGRWEFVGSSNPDAYVEFTEYGNWFGSDGCNGTGANWRVESGTLVMDNDGLSTLMLCDNQHLPAASPLSGTLTAAGMLEISGNDTTVTLTRVSDSSATLVGGTWRSSLGMRPDLATTIEGPSIAFAADGTWTGSDGCNRMGGTWRWMVLLAVGSADTGFSGSLYFGEDSFSTKMACPGQDPPAGIFSGTYTFSMAGTDTLVLRESGASVAATNGLFFTRAAD